MEICFEDLLKALADNPNNEREKLFNEISKIKIHSGRLHRLDLIPEQDIKFKKIS